ncbi:MAG: aminodeoxychorismate synthase component I, partial [Flavobacterium sp.]
MSHFQRKLNTQNPSIFKLLTQLYDLSGLVYLHDENHPVIAFLPQEFLVLQQSTFSQFYQTEFNQYQISPTTQSIIEFSNFNFPSTIQSDCLSFNGGYIGFSSYDYSAYQFINASTTAQPSFFLGRYLSFLKYHDGAWYFYSFEDQAAAIYQYICQRLTQPAAHNFSLTLFEKCQARWSKQQYLQAFRRVQEYIKAGDCYQINLTQEFKAIAQGSLLSRAEALWELTHAPYAGYLKLNNFELLSCSPELFIEFQKDRNIKTRPIKGTMPRFEDPEQDQISKNKLSNSEKDQAENVMIVDLLRNDLSVYAETGSV